MRDGIRRIDHPGKFEGETVLTLYAYDLSLTGGAEYVGDDDGGASYTRVDLDGLTDEELKSFRFHDDEYGGLTSDERAELLGYVGCILYESSSGFVSGTFYRAQDKFDRAWDRVESLFDDPDDDDDESDDD